MKESKYNFSFNDGETVILYNARTNALAKLNNYDYQCYRELVSNKEAVIDEALLKSLTYGGYVINDEINELDMIKHGILASRFATNVLNLTIAPTSNCNFRCPYCYEKEVLHQNVMDDLTANDIIEFIKINIGHLDSLNITWYGGEPLLELTRICDLSKMIIELCKENKVKYFASIITNGYLLTKSVMLKLIECKVKNIQITLDGPKKYHDDRRYLVGKKPTYDQIINNLISYTDICGNENFPFISVRMNVDQNNIKGVSELKKLLSEKPFNSYIYFYIAAVYDKDDLCNRYTYTPQEFGEIDTEFKNTTKLDYNQFYPSLTGVHCVCDSLTGLVIDSDGSLYKCWEEIGNIENCIGNIKTFEFSSLKQTYYDYLMFDPIKDRKCKDCSVLPICVGGGCPHRIIKDKYRPDCEYIIEKIHSNIITSYNILNKK